MPLHIPLTNWNHQPSTMNKGKITVFLSTLYRNHDDVIVQEHVWSSGLAPGSQSEGREFKPRYGQRVCILGQGT